jgi:glycosyltransferase involved in cell wall biosynthesis
LSELITVVIPAYNVGGFIGATLESIRNQTSIQWKVIVIDDGSTDNTASVVESLSYDRVTLVQQANAGLSAARNAGLMLVTTPYVLFLDADDLLFPESIERFLTTLSLNLEAVGVYGSVVHIDMQGRQVRGVYVPADVSWSSEDNLMSFLQANVIENIAQCCFRAFAVKEVQGFRHFSPSEDWDLMCRIASRGRLAALDKDDPVLMLRQRTGSLVRSTGRNFENYEPSIDSVFSDPGIIERIGKSRSVKLRQRVEARYCWLLGRQALIARDWSEARSCLFAALRRTPFKLGLWILLALTFTKAVPNFLRARIQTHRAFLED